MPKIGRLKHFAGFIRTFDPVTDLVESIECFHRPYQDTWIDESEVSIDDDRKHDFVKAIDGDEYYRKRKSAVVNVPFRVFDAVVVARFCVPPQRRKCLRLVEALNQALKYSDHEYGASHDPMTGLLNIKGFGEVAKKLAKVSKTARKGNNEEVASKSIPMIALYALDIDFFKQVNDTFGHAYGDVVLKCLGNRLEAFSNTTANQQLQMCVARPSGEEFLVVVRGDLSPSTVKEVGDEIRFVVSSSPLPSESEWRTLSDDVPPEMTLPKPSDRRLTVSIGVATVVSNESLLGTEWVLKLRSQADRALYSAKANGRNVVIPFSEILQSHGSIVEHHEEMGVVSINLGLGVGSRIGQEFFVYHPDFTGGVDLTQSDGRTIKRLGTYPRRQCGRVVVFDVQDEVSFCRVAESELSGPFPTGSSLEAIPMGSIGHLVTEQYALVDDTGLSPLASLESTLKSAADEGQAVACMVIGLVDTEELIRQRGNVFINECLARLFGCIRAAVTGRAQIAQLSNTQFAVVATSGNVDGRAVGQVIVDEMEAELGQTVRLACGLWDSTDDVDVTQEGSETSYDETSAIEYSRYALEYAGIAGMRVAQFSEELAHQVLSHLYGRGDDRLVLETHRELTRMGLKASSIENMAGVSAFRLGSEDDLMLRSGKEAVRLEPSDVVLRENLITYYWKTGNVEAIFDVYTGIVTEFPLHEPRESLLGIIAMAHVNEFRAEGKVSKEMTLKLLEKAVASDANQFQYGREKSAFEDAISQIDVDAEVHRRKES